MLEQAEAARQEIGALTESPNGRVVLGCSSAVGTAVIGNIFAAFRERFPKAALEIIEIKGWAVYEWLLQGRLDIGILYDPRPSSSIKTIPLRKTELCLVSSASRSSLEKAATVSFRDLSRYPLILPSAPRAIRLAVERAAALEGTTVNMAINVEGAPVILELVSRGYGYTILPKEVVLESRQLEKLQLNSLVDPKLMWVLAIAVPAKRQMTRLTHETTRIISQLCRDQAEFVSPEALAARS